MKKVLLFVLALIMLPAFAYGECDCPGDPPSDMNEITGSAITADAILYLVNNPGGAASEGKVLISTLPELAGSAIDKTEVFSGATNVSVGDGAAYLPFGEEYDGWNLTYALGIVKTAATGSGSETIDITIYNITDAQDVLSVPLSIDEDETTSLTAATAVSINTSYDDVDEGDLWEINIDGVPSTTPGTGLWVVLGFTKQ